MTNLRLLLKRFYSTPFEKKSTIDKNYRNLIFVILRSIAAT